MAEPTDPLTDFFDHLLDFFGEPEVPQDARSGDEAASPPSDEG